MRSEEHAVGLKMGLMRLNMGLCSRGLSKRMMVGGLFAALCAAGLDTPHYVRNYHRQIPMLLSSMANAVSKKRIAKGTGVA